MRPKTLAAAVLLALAVAAPSLPAVSAAAAPTASTNHSVAAEDRPPAPSKGESAKTKAKPGKKAKKVNLRFNLRGRLAAVDAEAGTVTFTVHGGKDKALRGTDLTVVVAAGARVTRDDAAATLADLVAGDKVRAKGAKVDGVYTANRVMAEAPASADEPAAPEA